MTKKQRKALQSLFVRCFLACEYVQLRHGGCVGADIEALDTFMTKALQTPSLTTKVWCHPGNITHYVGMSESYPLGDVVLAAKPPLARNRDIIDASNLIFGCPAGPEETRSGTWSTIRYAKKQNKNPTVILPDGSYDEAGFAKQLEIFHRK